MTHTIIRHPTKDGWTFKTRENRWLLEPKQAKQRKAYRSPLAVMIYLRSRSVSWKQIVWDWIARAERKRAVKLSDVINPSDINTSPGLHWSDTFDQAEREVSARWIVRFCQQRDNWEPFAKADIEAFYNEGGYKDFWFNGLVVPEYGISEHDGTYHIESEFIRRVCKWLVEDVPALTCKSCGEPTDRLYGFLLEVPAKCKACYEKAIEEEKKAGRICGKCGTIQKNCCC